MALMLRKAVLPRNVTLLKCLKSRHVTTTAHKQNPAPLSNAAIYRSLRRENRAMSAGYLKTRNTRRLSPARGRQQLRRGLRVRLSQSCPTLIPASRPKIAIAVRHLSPPRIRPALSLSVSLLPPLLRPATIIAGSRRAYSSPTPCSCGCPCPFPCGPCGCAGGCNCLPPPCNVPAKCIQYMTGYYYYPYGTWFCGPYHVTGTCCPVGPCGPCGPGSPCPGKCCACCIAPMMYPGVTPMCPPIGAMSAPPTAPLAPEIPRTGIVPGNQIRCPLPPDQHRNACKSGISRFLPFDSNPRSPTIDSKRGPLPTTTVLSSCMYPNCTSPQDKPYTDIHDLILMDSFKSCSKLNRCKQNRPLNRCFSSVSSSRPICKRSKYSSPLEKPRALMSIEQRDRPRIMAGAFDFSSTPNYRNPYPNPQD